MLTQTDTVVANEATKKLQGNYCYALIAGAMVHVSNLRVVTCYPNVCMFYYWDTLCELCAH